MDQQCNRPTGRGFLDLGQLAARQLALEELLDLRCREAELVRAYDKARTFEDLHGQVEARIRPERHGEVEIAGTVLDEPRDRLNGLARKSVHLIEHQQARRLVQIDGVSQHPNLVGHRG